MKETFLRNVKGENTLKEDDRSMLQNGKIMYAPAYTSLLITVFRWEQDFTWKASIEQRKRKEKKVVDFSYNSLLGC